ncbi:NAD(P)-binding domain-containing protein [Chitinophaga filiformis]|uniref:NAD(P)-dependent oxidoreductase n=1 Tax=Chitinophaga filiformis TaxID=104663 RepID=UPI001F1EFBBA|nr:NAD(P)-binding domain-containing protein [Chitinophaga filiformis]MCF6405131.1 NAD(P)-binding domain-containing protein [Chitinophaga filiformis]
MREKVSIIGLGAMGSVLAQLLVQEKQMVTVWNRTAAKAEQLVKDGANYTADIHAAVHASPLVIICVLDYAVTYELLRDVDVQGKTIVQLSTGTPQDAREMAAMMQSRGALYLDGAILATPSQMGQPSTPIFLSGAETAFKRSEAVLKMLAGTLLYMGDAPGAAAAWDLAALSSMFGMMFGFFHGARIIEAEGLEVAALGNMISDISPVLGQMVKSTADDIQQEHYTSPQSSLEICALSFELMKRQAAESRIEAPFPAFALELFNKARAAGYGDERLAAMMKVLR